jgi:tryptophan synthase alpha chain
MEQPMNRYDQVMANLKSKGEIAFVPYAVAGDPGIRASESIFKTYVDAGADILEIGYPFSDPVADGPVNQRGAIRAINAGLNHRSFFSLVKTLRRYTDIPFGMLCYANTIIHVGRDEFCKRAAEAGLDSILVADMPPEESGELLGALRRWGLKSVFIVSELTPQPRARTICRDVTGFVYVVSRLGTTGVQKAFNATAKETLDRLRTVTNKPLCVGFGISAPDHVRAAKKAGADGAIVGSALVSIVEQNLADRAAMLQKLSRDVRRFKDATR